MSTVTTNLGLFKYNTTTDANVAFNINTALNNNWDIIDSAMAGGGLPDQTGKSGYLLTTNGSTASWGETGEIYPVIETYQNGSSWYRVYSDGWCEQGGVDTGTGSEKTITFLKPFANTNYSLSIAPMYYNNVLPGFISKTTSSVGGWALSGYPFCWQACGYIEV